jgi:hypothetical protein
MAISALNANTWQQKQQDFNNLTLALNAGNLQGAQKAFSALTKNSPSPCSITSSSTATNTHTNAAPSSSLLGNPMAALSAALASGNIQAAQQTFAALPTTTILQTNAVQATAFESTHTSTTNQKSQLPLAAYGSIGTHINTMA